MDSKLKKVLLEITDGYEREYIDKYETYIPRGFRWSKDKMEEIYKKALENDTT